MRGSVSSLGRPLTPECSFQLNIPEPWVMVVMTMTITMMAAMETDP